MPTPIHPNRFLWFKSPTVEQIKQAAEIKGVTIAQFCRVAGANHQSVRRFFCGDHHELFAPYWHIVYNTLGIPPDNPDYIKPVPKHVPKPKKKKRLKRATSKDPVLRAFL